MMFRIGEFSKLTQVSIRMLRYYDEVGLLTPAEVDKWTGHRLYSVEQIPRLNKILYLRDSGLNVSEIALALTMDKQSLLAQLNKKRIEIENAIQSEQEKLRKIELAKNEIQDGKGEMHYNISVKSIPAYHVLSLRRVVPTYRPVVIIQNNVGNKHSPTVIIASITSKTGVKAKLPTHYYIDAEDGLELPSIVLLEQLRTVDKRRLSNFIGHLSEKHICGINHALAVSIGLIESVPKKLILCLCSTCADNFYGTGAYYLRRIDPHQTAKDTCTYCNSRKGFDYELIQKSK